MLPALAITLVIQFTDLAGVPPAVMRDAKAAMTAILADVDVTVAWAPAGEPAPAHALAVRLTVLPQERGALRSSDRPVMGVALRTARGTRIAYVYYERLLQEANRHRVPSAQLLACAMAHEIGHLVQASPGHDPRGLMRGEWTRAEFRQASAGHLRFATRFDAGTR